MIFPIDLRNYFPCIARGRVTREFTQFAKEWDERSCETCRERGGGMRKTGEEVDLWCGGTVEGVEFFLCREEFFEGIVFW